MNMDGNAGAKAPETREETIAREQAWLKSLPKHPDPEVHRISEAMEDEPEFQPPRPRSEMTLMELAQWEMANPKLMEVRMAKGAVMTMLSNARSSGQLSDDDFEDLLEECRTHSGRMALLQRSYVAAQAGNGGSGQSRRRSGG